MDLSNLRDHRENNREFQKKIEKLYLAWLWLAFAISKNRSQQKIECSKGEICVMDSIGLSFESFDRYSTFLLRLNLLSITQHYTAS